MATAVRSSEREPLATVIKRAKMCCRDRAGEVVPEVVSDWFMYPPAPVNLEEWEQFGDGCFKCCEMVRCFFRDA
jgi:hypothetical protein